MKPPRIVNTFVFDVAQDGKIIRKGKKRKHLIFIFIESLCTSISIFKLLRAEIKIELKLRD